LACLFSSSLAPSSPAAGAAASQRRIGGEKHWRGGGVEEQLAEPDPRAPERARPARPSVAVGIFGNPLRW
jgi:hypothetical protein